MPSPCLQKVKDLKIGLNFVADTARDIVDIVFVLDVVSASINAKEFEESKIFGKNYLEYFSIAPGHSQVRDFS